MKCRKVMFVMFAGLLVITITQSHLWSGEPDELVKEVILKNCSQDDIKDMQEHKTMIWEEISPSFDFREISKRVMGQYWGNLLDEEKSEFEALFTNYLKKSYIGKTNPLFGKKIISIREKSSNKFAKVQTKLLTETDKEVSTDFYLFNKNSEWKIYDLVVEGVSLINNYRSQIYSTISKNSFKGLVQIMKQSQGKGRDSLLVSGWTKQVR